MYVHVLYVTCWMALCTLNNHNFTSVTVRGAPTRCYEDNALVPPQYLNREPAVSAEHFGLCF